MESAESLQGKRLVSAARRQEMRDKFIQHIHNEYAQWLTARPSGTPSVTFHAWLQMDVPWEPILETVTATSPAHPEAERRVDQWIRSQIKHLELAVKMFSHCTDPIWNDAFKASGLELGAIVLEFCDDLQQGRVHGPNGPSPVPSKSPAVNSTPSVQSWTPLTTPDDLK